MTRIKPVHLLSVLVFISVLTSGFTAFKLNQVEKELESLRNAGPGQENARVVSLPTGTPDIYGKELDVEYQDVSQESPQKAEKVLKKFSSYDGIELSEENRQRYIDILYDMNGGISCEYCCEARSVINEKGEPGCGCSHAVAMRGLTKYLLKNHGEEMTNQEIFGEVSRWKTRYFPKQTESKAAALQQQGTEVTYVNLASNEYRGVSSSKGGWVGDC